MEAYNNIFRVDGASLNIVRKIGVEIICIRSISSRFLNVKKEIIVNIKEEELINAITEFAKEDFELIPCVIV